MLDIFIVYIMRELEFYNAKIYFFVLLNGDVL